jgi:hypothetical protein
MADPNKKTPPPSREKSGGNGQSRPEQTGPSPRVREKFIKELKKIIKKKKKPGG